MTQGENEPEELTPENGVYTITYTDGMTDLTVTITTEAVDNEPEEDIYTPYAITVESAVDSVEVVFDEGCTATGDGDSKVTVKDTALVFSVTVPETHDITKVSYEIGEAETATELTAGEAGKYTIESTVITGAVKILVEVTEKVMELEYVPYEVTVVGNEYADVVFAEGCTAEADGKNVTVDGKDLVFTVNLKEEVKDSHEIKGVSYKINEVSTPLEKDGEGNYTIANANITGAVEISVEASAKAESQVSWTGEHMTIVAADETVTIQGNTYTILEGEEFKFKVIADEGYSVKSVMLGEEELKADDKGIYTITGTTENQEVIVDTVAVEFTFSGEEGTWRLENDRYSIIAGAHYTASVYKDGTKVAATDATLDGGNSYKWNSTHVWDGDVEVYIKSLSFNSTTPKEMDVKITTEETDETLIPLTVYPGIKSVTVSGVSKGKATQAYNSEKEYAFTVSPKNIFDVVGVKYTDESGVIDDIYIKDGKLIIKTSERNGSVDVKLYNKVESRINEENDEYSYYKYIDGGEFTLEVTGPAFTNVKPTVALQSATNTELTLKLGAKGIATPSEGKLWYEVTTELVDTADAKSGVYTTVTQYYPYEGESQIATIAVADVSSDGSFPAVKNHVTVSVVQTADNTNPEEGGDILYRTNASKIATLKNVSTKAATYETKLTLKKGTTKLFTGQENVVVATPQFSKTTYFKDLNVEIQDNYGMTLDSSETGITAEYNEEEGKILVSVDDQTSAGKYSLKATVATPNGVKAVSSSVTFEVVYGINTIWFQNLPTNIYKVNGKAATISVEYSAYHGVNPTTDEYGTSYEYCMSPSKNSVKFSIVGADGQELSEALQKAISIKNGKLTVAKNYVADGERFCIQAEATDYAGNKMEPVISHSIGISSYAEEMGEIVLGKWSWGEDGGFEVVKSFETEKTLSIDDVKGLTFAVLRKDVNKDDNVYTWEEVIGSGVKFTSSNKNVVIGGEGYIQSLTKESKNVTITATMTDGSGKKITLKGLHFTGTKKDIGITVYGGEYGGIMEPLIDTTGTIRPDLNSTECSYNGILNKTVLQVQIGNTNSLYGMAPNFKVTISGAKTLSKYSSSHMHYYTLEPNKKDVTITIENKNTGVKDVYKLTNSNYDAIEALGTVKVEGNFVQYSKTPDYVTLKLPTGYEGKYAKLYFDNSKLMKDGKYATFAYNSIDNSPVQIADDNTVQISLKPDHYPYYSGSFKFSVCVGTVDEYNEFVPLTKSKDVTFKVTAAKAGKVKTSYTMNLKDMDTVTLTTNVKGSEVVSINSIENINFKGVPNKFTDYFEINGNTLKLKDDIDSDLLQKLYSGKAKDDLKGWITCTVKSSDYYQSQAVQVTINAKNASSGKYAVPNVNIVEGDSEAVVTVNKTANKVTEKAEVQYVCADNYIDVWTVDANVCIGTGSTWQFAPGKTKTVTLYVVDDDAPASVKNAIENAWDKYYDDGYYSNYEYYEYYESLIKAFGTKVTAKVTVVKKADVAKKDKVALTTKTLTLTDKNLTSYDEELAYVGEVGYSELIEEVKVSGTTIKVNSTNKELVTFIESCVTIADGKIHVAIPQAELDKSELIKWKGNVSVTIEFDFGEEYGKESEKLTIKFPAKPKALG